MPKCLNNNNKSYKGTENSPLGLGYCSNSEETGTIKIGKDGKEWIVKQTKSSKRWTKINLTNTRSTVFVEDSSDDETKTKIETKPKTKIETKPNNNESIKDESKDESEVNLSNLNFDKFPPSFYKDVYFPKIIKLLEETGFEEKFGGNIPFFIEGEEWPKKDNIYMTFLCQFCDPLRNNNILYRIFISNDDYTIELKKIDFSDKNKEKQIILKNNTVSLESFKINGWDKKIELLSYNHILKKLNLLDCEDLDNKYFSSEFTPSYGIKIAGSPRFTQGEPRNSGNYDFLQLTQSKFLNFEWGDSGICHLTRVGQYYFDSY
jgi:hypothetical protein